MVLNLDNLLPGYVMNQPTAVPVKLGFGRMGCAKLPSGLIGWLTSSECFALSDRAYAHTVPMAHGHRARLDTRPVFIGERTPGTVRVAHLALRHFAPCNGTIGRVTATSTV